MKSIHSKNIFLVDGLGAATSALLLGAVLLTFQEVVGMPERALYILMGLAFLFSTYSFICHFWVRPTDKVFLKIIMTANLLYCILTASLVAVHCEHVTTVGKIYFGLEIIVILWLVNRERKVLLVYA